MLEPSPGGGGRSRRGWVAFETGKRQKDEGTDRATLLQLAEGLSRVWHDPESDMRLKERIVRALIEEILVARTKNRPASIWSFAGSVVRTLDSRSGSSAGDSTAIRRTTWWWRS